MNLAIYTLTGVLILYFLISVYSNNFYQKGYDEYIAKYYEEYLKRTNLEMEIRMLKVDNKILTDIVKEFEKKENPGESNAEVIRNMKEEGLQ